jgi:hypothetical protein
MVTAMRVAGDEEGKGDKATTMATRMVGEWTAMVTKKAMAMATRVWASNGDGNKEGDGNGDGNKGSGQQRGQWRQQQERWRRRQWWLASNSNKGNSNKGGG